MEVELEFLKKNRTRMLVDLPRNQKVVECKLIFNKMEEILGVREQRFKADGKRYYTSGGSKL